MTETVYKLTMQKLQEGYMLKAYASSDSATLRRLFPVWEDVAQEFVRTLNTEQRELDWLKTELDKANCGVEVFENWKTAVTREIVDNLGLRDG
jgi:hypothetical protein